MTANVASDLASTGGVANQRRVFEVERLDDRCEIVGIAIHVVVLRGLARTAMAAAIMSDHAEALLRKEEHLPVPGVGIQWPAMREVTTGPLPQSL